jgi:hypothetical protein
VVGHGNYGVKGAGSSDGTSTLNALCARRGLHAQRAGRDELRQYPATNACGASIPTTLGADRAMLAAKLAGVVVVDPLSLRPRAINRAALKIPHPAPKPECQSAAKNPLVAAKCDVPLKP